MSRKAKSKAKMVEVPIYISLQDSDLDKFLQSKNNDVEGVTRVFHSLRYPAFIMDIPEPDTDEK